MTLRDALTILLRRWVVVLVGGILSVAACIYALDNVKPSYQANADVLFVLPPQATGRSTPTNPLLNLQDGLGSAASVVGTEVTSVEVTNQLAEQGYDAEYTVTLVPGVGPLLNITALDDDPVVAQATRNALIDEVNQRLAELQTRVGTPQRQTILTTTSDIGAEPTELGGNRTRALAGTAALGLLLTLLVAFTLDPLLRRSAERGATSVEHDDPGPSAAGGDDSLEGLLGGGESGGPHGERTDRGRGGDGDDEDGTGTPRGQAMVR